MSNVLIVGGEGFIGSHLQRSLLNRQKNVYVIDSLLERVHGKIKISRDNFYKIDVRNLNDLNSNFGDLIEEVSEVYFLASDTSTGNSYLEIDEHVNQNVTNLATFLKFIDLHPSKLKRFVLTSSRAVYGEGHAINSKKAVLDLPPRKIQDLIDEYWENNLPNDYRYIGNHYKNKANPVSIYGLTKLFQEDLLKLWARQKDIEVNIYRLQNVIGPGQSPNNPYSGVITYFMTRVVDNMPIEVFEGGGVIRDFVRVHDVCEALQISISNEFKTVDVGTGTPMKLIEIAELIREISPETEIILSNKFRAGDVRSAYADAESYKSSISGWKPKPIDKEYLNSIFDYVSERYILQ